MSKTVQMISIIEIDIINPRTRNAAAFQEIVESIDLLGLKKPITVRRKDNSSSHLQYDLVCGQGRIEAFLQLKQKTIPAFVLDADEESCLVMSLVENIARRRFDHDTFLKEVKRLKSAGDSQSTISRKLGISTSFTSQIFSLINSPSEDLIQAVERKKIPISVAMELAAVPDEKALSALQKAYESGELRGQKFTIAKKIIEKRISKSKRGPRHKRPLTKDSLIRAFEQEANKQKKIIYKSESVQKNLIMTYSALKTLITDEHFITLLRAENLDTIPRYLKEKLTIRE
jgi:ParB family transcriptional regulator, chromosome partitioning protein